MTRARLRDWRVALAVVVGLGVGAVLRNVPLAMSVRLVSGPVSSSSRCGMEQVLDCTFEQMPHIFGGLLKLGVVAVLLSGILGVAGVVSVGLALGLGLRGRPTAADGPAMRWPYLLLLGVGVALIVPGAWLACSFIVFVLR